MKPSTHRYILAPILVGIHAVLLLPLIFPPKILRPPHFPDASGHPWPDYGTPPQGPKLGRLHLKYSVPLGFAGIAGVWISKQLAGSIPLPKDPRRKVLAMWLESGVLFGIGVLEEVWRYGLVRLFMGYMGGHGGYRGTTAVKRNEGDFEGSPTLWEGLYVMAWVWSIFECLYSWYGVRPNPHDCGKHHTQSSPTSASKRIQAHFRRNSEGLAHVSHYQKRPPLGKRTRSDSIMGGASDETRAVFHSFGRKKRETASTTTTNAKPREIEDRSIHFVDNNTTAAESESSRTAYDESIRPTNSSLLIKGKNPIDGDLETGLLSRLREIRREQAEEQADSDNGYGDDEESVSSGSEDDDSARSSIDSERFESVTPLLSSSLPYDPSQQHPHHESQALLQNQRQQITYNTMATANSLPLEPTDDNNEDEVVTVHDCDIPNQNSSHENRFSDHGRDSTPKTQRSPIDRAYPSYPPYSAAYNNAHFSATSSAPPGPSSGYGTTAVINRPVQQKRKSTNTAVKTQRCSSRTVYGANVNTLRLHLPLLWRTAALLRHISHTLIYAWAPALVFSGHFQWISFLVLFLLAAKKGWSTMEWFGGGASRTGLTKASIISFIIAIILYFISLVLWGIVP